MQGNNFSNDSYAITNKGINKHLGFYWLTKGS